MVKAGSRRQNRGGRKTKGIKQPSSSGSPKPKNL